jgi:hypothetical protein
MDDLAANLISVFCYLDDILVTSPNEPTPAAVI